MRNPMGGKLRLHDAQHAQPRQVHIPAVARGQVGSLGHPLAVGQAQQRAVVGACPAEPGRAAGKRPRKTPDLVLEIRPLIVGKVIELHVDNLIVATVQETGRRSGADGSVVTGTP
jgi:hypothetical protein